MDINLIFESIKIDNRAVVAEEVASVRERGREISGGNADRLLIILDAPVKGVFRP